MIAKGIERGVNPDFFRKMSDDMTDRENVVKVRLLQSVLERQRDFTAIVVSVLAA